MRPNPLTAMRVLAPVHVGPCVTAPFKGLGGRYVDLSHPRCIINLTASLDHKGQRDGGDRA